MGIMWCSRLQMKRERILRFEFFILLCIALNGILHVNGKISSADEMRTQHKTPGNEKTEFGGSVHLVPLLMHKERINTAYYAYAIVYPAPQPVNNSVSHVKAPYRMTTIEELKAYLTKLLSENASQRSCPAPIFPIDEKDCNLTICSTSSDCKSENESCCYNGCVFTCMNKISPPPVIDWDEEPMYPPVRKEGSEVLHCTSTQRPAPSEPAGCPKGYVCKIDDDGDPLEGRLSTGLCVPETTTDVVETHSEPSGLEENTRKQTVYIPGGCILTEEQYKHMKDFMTRSYVIDCLCIDGSIECQIASKAE